jgi:hypothetical protein
VSVELWGTDKTCGSAQELLWWGPLDQSVQCATFTPTREYDSVVLVMRRLEHGDYTMTMRSSTHCGASGQCPGGASGHGLSPGTKLDAPVGVYNADAWRKRPNIREFQVGLTGDLVAKFAADPPDDATTPMVSGIFRMDPATPHGDAWYCIGPGSTYSHRREENGNHYTMALRNVTRTACVPGGSGSVLVTGPARTVTSTFGLAAPPASALDPRCTYFTCTFVYDAPAGVRNWIHGTTSSSVGHSADPIKTPTSLVDSLVLRAYDDDRPTQFACGTAGTLTYDPPSNTTFQATGMTDWAECPSNSTGGESVDLELYD